MLLSHLGDLENPKVQIYIFNIEFSSIQSSFNNTEMSQEKVTATPSFLQQLCQQSFLEPMLSLEIEFKRFLRTK